METFFADFVTNFHFLRPWFLLAIVFVIPLFLAIRKKQDLGGIWGKVCDANLLPALLVKGADKTYNVISSFMAIAFVTAVIAAAGPTWQKLPVATVIGGTNTVFVLDMGLNMAATDVTPSRLDRAKFKMYDMLAKAKGDQAGLVLFDNLAYVASPLSEDLSVISNIIPTLEINIMPGNGISALDKGVEEATKLLKNAGQGNGRIIVLTGAGSQEAISAQKAVQKAVAEGNVVSVLAIGTEAGAPARNDKGGFYADASGKTALFKTDVAGLRNLATLGGGGFSMMANDGRDIDTVMVTPIDAEQMFSDANVKADTWKDMGIYLLFPVLLIVLFAFKKGFIAVLLLAFCLPLSANAGWWQDLWFNQNQQAKKSLQDKNYTEAAKSFNDSAWKGYAHYKAGEYNEAIKALTGKTDAESLYNLGNAKAQAGDIQGAIDTYEKAVKIDKDHKDAIFNRDYLKKIQEQQQKQDKKDQDKDKNKDQNQNQNQDQNNNDSKDNDQSQDKNKDAEKDQQKSGDNAKQEPDKQDNQQQQKQEQQDKKDNQQTGQEQDKQQGEDEDKNNEEQSKAGNDDKQNQQPEPDEKEQNENQQSGQSEQQKEDKGADKEEAGSAGAEDKQNAEQKPATGQWLNRIEEDKGGLIRARLQKIYRTKNGE